MALHSESLLLIVIPECYYIQNQVNTKTVLHSESLLLDVIPNWSLVHRWFSRKLRLKVGLSTAYFKRTAVTESSMPTPRAKAAFKYLLASNKYYKKYWEMQKELLENDRILTISSFDLCISYTGIE